MFILEDIIIKTPYTLNIDPVVAKVLIGFGLTLLIPIASALLYLMVKGIIISIKKK